MSPDVQVYEKTDAPTRLTIPTGSRISTVRCPLNQGYSREVVQADALTIAAGAWEMHFAEPLDWSDVTITITYTSVDVTVELRVDPT